MDKAQAQAICQMGESRHQYNQGVLSMLDKRRLADDHEAVCRTIAMLVEDRDRLIPDSASPLDPLSAEAEAIQKQIDEAVTRQAEAWAPIQAIIDEARAELDTADPLGLGQAI